MGKTIKTMYVVHHSHTDIGYTDLQERIIDGQANYIRTVLNMLKDTEKNGDFRWNCETYFCVEHFFKTASEEEKEAFFEYVRQGKIGLSATYLNFNDLLDSGIFERRLKEMVDLFKAHDIVPATAMFADINGISMGQRDAMLDHGIEFLFTNIHTHHGMYPLYQNQTPFWWENAEGKRLLVWNGEHYNLGNALGIKANRSTNFMAATYFGKCEDFSEPAKMLHENLENYISQCEDNGYAYDFIVSGVSGVFSDNAPPNLEILETIKAYNESYGDSIRLQMVSLQELYVLIRDKIQDSPVHRGDMTDWWANGVGSTPYAVKHYKEARKLYHLCKRMDPEAYDKHPLEARSAEDNLMLYAEHTWGHSSTIGDPYDTMVLNLDIRKNSYASKAHESSSLMLNRIAEQQGDILRYYNTNGKIRVKNVGNTGGKLPVEFYIESCVMKNVKIIDVKNEKEITSQLSPHPRGVRITFVDEFKPMESKEYNYVELPEEVAAANTRKAYVGAERIKDIINDYEPIPCHLPYRFENEWFCLTYELYQGITGFVNKKTGQNMLPEGMIPFFTPIYERTEIRHPGGNYSERSILGRNIRGKHAISHAGVLTEVNCKENGKVFTLLEFKFDLPGTKHCAVVVKFYEALPKIDFKLRLAKDFDEAIESVYMPLTLSLPNKMVYLKKGTEAFRPGIDQLPGSCMEYYMSDDGVVLTSESGSVLIETSDVPLVTMGELKHHPVRLCDGNPVNNSREMYSWVMNNTWETNFKLDLSGCCEFLYHLTLTDEVEPEACFHELEEKSYLPYTLIVE